MAISEKQKALYDRLARAVADGKVALLECTERTTGETRNLICVVRHTEDGADFAPLAVLAWTDLKTVFAPPDTDDDDETVN